MEESLSCIKKRSDVFLWREGLLVFIRNKEYCTSVERNFDHQWEKKSLVIRRETTTSYSVKIGPSGLLLFGFFWENRYFLWPSMEIRSCLCGSESFRCGKIFWREHPLRYHWQGYLMIWPLWIDSQKKKNAFCSCAESRGGFTPRF